MDIYDAIVGDYEITRKNYNEKTKILYDEMLEKINRYGELQWVVIQGVWNKIRLNEFDNINK